MRNRVNDKKKRRGGQRDDREMREEKASVKNLQDGNQSREGIGIIFS